MSGGRRFFGHLRRGLRALAADARSVQVVLRLGGLRATEVATTLDLAGPGAVRGLGPGAVRGRIPAPGATDFRAGALPYVEVADPALPWSFSPAPEIGGAVRPFLGLICVPAGAVAYDPAALPLPRAAIDLPVDGPGLPDPRAFALLSHVEDPDGGTDAPGPRSFARLLCAQRLAPNTDHRALVVPLYAAGVAAGLDDPALPATGDAWAPGARSALLPVYDSWTFRTGPGRGPEELLRALRAAPPRGTDRRLPVLPSPAAPALDGGTVVQRAIFSAAPRPAERIPDLAQALDGPAARRAGRLGLPDYGRGHAGEGARPRWLDDLNLDPSLRVMAGHGAALVRRRQEEIVGFVLDHAGEIEAANAVLARARAAMAATGRIHARLDRRDDGSARPLAALLPLVGPAAARMAIDGAPLAAAAGGMTEGPLLDPDLRRRMAAGGALDRDRQGRGDMRAALAAVAQDAARPPRAPAAEALTRDLDTVLGRSRGAMRLPEGMTLGTALDRLASGGGVDARPGDGDAETGRAFAGARDADLRRPVRGPVAPGADPGLRDKVLRALDPAVTIPPRIRARISGVDLPDPLPPRIELPEPIWPRPILGELFDLDPDILSPSLAALPADGVMALQVDAAAVDAVMVGANHELMRELAWRGIPVPHAVSPVRRMFPAPDAGTPRPTDSHPIAAWGDRPLGAGRASAMGLVILIRSALFRRFPGTIVTLAGARWDTDADGRPLRRLDPAVRHAPVAMGAVGEDCTYVIFAPARDEMAGDADPAAGRPGGFLVFEQADDGASFGLNATPGTGSGWTDLGWDDLSTDHLERSARSDTRDGLEWGADAATMAAILLERDLVLAIHVSDLTEP